ncbi:putative transporter svop-1 [Drosophila pseudoobscura]|uniref:Transporter svop-1 n=1 Tax=Drosophila pseudoobscura pseudoobscura TaxID=46245 RepID=B5DP78_DROPS|nr:putative transporter svop-1 [Drosophila pseudoobscura]
MADIDDVFGRLGFGRMQIFIFCSCAVIQVYVTNEQLGLVVIVAGATCDLGIHDHRLSWLYCAVITGQILISPYMGYKADEIGRRKMLLITMILSLAASLLSALMPEFWSFLVMRFFVGLFVTGPSSLIVTYLSEFTKISLRGSVINYQSYFIGISMILMTCVASVLLPLKLNHRIVNDYALTSWRVVALLNLLPGIIGLVTLWFLPESPKYYLAVDQQKRAMEALERCCRLNKGKDVTLSSLGVESVTQPRLPEKPIHRSALARQWYDVAPLLRGLYFRHLALASAAIFILLGTGAGLASWMLRVRNLTLKNKDSQTICVVLEKFDEHKMDLPKCDLGMDDLKDSVFHGLAVLGVFIFTSILLIWFGRRVIVFLYVLGAALAGFLLNFAKDETLILVLFLIYIVAPLCSLRLTLSMLIDLIPTNLRGKAVSISMMVGCLGGLVASLFVGYTMKLNCYVTFNTFVLALIFCAILIVMLPSDGNMRFKKGSV